MKEGAMKSINIYNVGVKKAVEKRSPYALLLLINEERKTDTAQGLNMLFYHCYYQFTRVVINDVLFKSNF